MLPLLSLDIKREWIKIPYGEVNIFLKNILFGLLSPIK